VTDSPCPLCPPLVTEVVLWRGSRCRVVDAGDVGYPGYCRVVWNEHVREMSDLAAEERQYLMDVVFAVESTLREMLRPDKINLAALGNRVPHLHWHVIPRFSDDAHYPDAIWSEPRRAGRVRGFEPAVLRAALAQRLSRRA
jgi:diadenosine tetraphosphate (Ap4A) HIT family hydrolase